jgi:hypothetical protein
VNLGLAAAGFWKDLRPFLDEKFGHENSEDIVELVRAGHVEIGTNIRIQF